MAEPATTTTEPHLVALTWLTTTARRLVHPAFGGVAAVGGAMIFAAIGWTAVGVVLRSDPDTIVRYWLWHIAAAALLPAGLGMLSVQLTHQGGYGVGAERAWLVWAQACAALAPLTGLLLMAARPLLFRGYDVHDRWGVPVLLAGGIALACAVAAGVRHVRRMPPRRRAAVTGLVAGVATASTGLAAIGLTALFLPAPLPCCPW
ncbi:hypothetical protein [Catellatospora coxensis]|uniref:Uncharacterized protein n=1 Tax=Catellatospora coxensis TaxID=310354 RepID=A0A8J3L4K4_9ACTN|nr:hypothetical protein [Catellatospora coxensis]GIG08481.1 hypothetical protein Cco03nite_51810 [Catellatospora coxensis]